MKANFKFFIYAFPAMDGCCGMEERELNGYLEMILNGKAPREKELDELFPAAQMRREEKYSDYWNFSNTENYWWVEHNRIIDAGGKGYEDADKEQKEDCKVKFWEIEEIENKIVRLKNNRGEKIKAFNYRNLELNTGRYVTTHKNHVIEEISFNDYSKYG